jgi:hypothetical protein
VPCVALFLVALAACLPSSQGAGADAGSSASNAADAGDAGNLGTNCYVSHGVTLCLGLISCPKVIVDQDKFPNCGFRIRGEIADLQCDCQGEELCPIGTPTSCSQAAQMLEAQSALTVCSQGLEGRCSPLVQGASSTSSSGGSNGCDKACAADCGNDFNCRKTCGC